MKTVIMAGGKGTRILEESEVRPKPMVEIGGTPILRHIMSIYAAQGFNHFITALGYKAEVIERYFAENPVPDWTVELRDTGVESMTGGRLLRLRDTLDSTFMMTYGDGVADVDIRSLVEMHKSHGKLATVTAVRPPSRFGNLEFYGTSAEILNFYEKRQGAEGWINGGFFVLEPGVLEYIRGEDMPFETEPLTRLAQDGQLMGFRHHGFFQPMDTLRDKRYLEDLWQQGKAPWKVWK